MGNIYKITNLINNKIYIGQTKASIFKRFKQHFHDRKKLSYLPLYKAFLKYSLVNFKVELIENCKNELLDEREIYYIDLFESYFFDFPDKGYNMTKGGKGHKDKKFVINNQGNIELVSIKEVTLESASKNKINVLQENGTFKKIDIKDYNPLIHKTNNSNRVVVYDPVSNLNLLIEKNDIRYLNKQLVSIHKNKTICYNLKGEIEIINSSTFDKKIHKGLNKDKVSGSENPNAKTITIFNNENQIVFVCNGNFKETCLKNNLPFPTLQRSYHNGGKPIFTIRNAFKKEFEKFTGWYAK